MIINHLKLHSKVKFQIKILNHRILLSYCVYTNKITQRHKTRTIKIWLLGHSATLTDVVQSSGSECELFSQAGSSPTDYMTTSRLLTLLCLCSFIWKMRIGITYFLGLLWRLNEFTHVMLLEQCLTHSKCLYNC